MRNDLNSENRLLGIVFLIFTILISVFALTEFIVKNPSSPGRLAGSIITLTEKDSSNIKDIQKTISPKKTVTSLHKRDSLVFTLYDTLE